MPQETCLFSRFRSRDCPLQGTVNRTERHTTSKTCPGDLGTNADAPLTNHWHITTWHHHIATCRRHITTCRRHITTCRRHITTCRRHITTCHRHIRSTGDFPRSNQGSLTSCVCVRDGMPASSRPMSGRSGPMRFTVGPTAVTSGPICVRSGAVRFRGRAVVCLRCPPRAPTFRTCLR
jgi:hypothetical protein